MKFIDDVVQPIQRKATDGKTNATIYYAVVKKRVTYGISLHYATVTRSLTPK